MHRAAACLLTGLIVAVLACAGCATRAPAAPGRLAVPAEMPRIAWPPREPPPEWPQLKPDGSARELVLVGVEGGGSRPIATLLAPIDARVLRLAPRGRGQIAEVRSIDMDAPEYKGAARYFWFYSSVTPRVPAGLSKGWEAPDAAEEMPVGPVEFQLVEPIGRPAHGLVIYMASIGALEYEQRVIMEMRRRGWAVLATVFPWGLTFEARRPPDAAASPEAFAAWVARRLDDRLAEWAYGCEAVLEDLAESRPELAATPIVIMSFSGGALGAPAVAARLMETAGEWTVGAAVLVGGGADLMRITQTSALFRGVPAARWTPARPAPDVLERLSAAYLGRAALDPAHTAAALRAVPVLQIHASADAIVPAPTGDLLYERLGRPERWTLPVGHELLFWRLPAYAGEIADWAEAAAGDRVRGSPARAPSGG